LHASVADWEPLQGRVKRGSLRRRRLPWVPAMAELMAIGGLTGGLAQQVASASPGAQIAALATCAQMAASSVAAVAASTE